MKSQFVRLLDVAVIGPFMFATSQSRERMTQNERDFLAFLGIATIAYNLANYFLVEAQEELDYLESSDEPE